MTLSNCTTRPLKTILNSLIFPDSDVLIRKKDQLKRLADLLQAVTYEDLSGCTYIEFSAVESTTLIIRAKVFAVGSSWIHLEKGLTLPLHRISKVTFCHDVV